jgi:hypothetical protein
MLSSLFELLVWTSVEGLGHVAVRSWQRSRAQSQKWPYDWKNRSDDPVYRKNLRRLMDYHRQFEDGKE